MLRMNLPIILPFLFLAIVQSAFVVSPPTKNNMNSSFDPSFVLMEEGQGYRASDPVELTNITVLPTNTTTPMAINSETCSPPIAQYPTLYTDHADDSLHRHAVTNLSSNVTHYVRMMTHFSGLMAESATDFLNEFEAHLILNNIDACSPKSAAAFQLQLKGPALTWFRTLSAQDRPNYNAIRPQFLKEYNDVNSPALVAEEAIFGSLSLQPTQEIEEFHSVVLRKGSRLQKSERDMLHRFIEGLPDQLAFFVRAGRVHSLRDALHTAKIGEAHGALWVKGSSLNAKARKNIDHKPPPIV